MKRIAKLARKINAPQPAKQGHQKRKQGQLCRRRIQEDLYRTAHLAQKDEEHQGGGNTGSAAQLRLVLANTGVRHGTEALGLRWRNVEWQDKGDERFLMVNVDGKTRKRSAVAKDTVEGYLDRQRKLNPKLRHGTFDELIAARSDESVFTTRLGDVANIASLNRAFNALLDVMDLKTGADGKERTLYSLRHYYATRDLKRGISQ